MTARKDGRFKRHDTDRREPQNGEMENAIKIYTEADVLMIEAQSAVCKEIVVAYVRKHTVVLSREEDGISLQAAVFGDSCLHVFKEWLLNPMPVRLKKEAAMRFEGVRV